MPRTRLQHAPTPTAQRIARECLAVRVRKASRMVSAIYDEALMDLGLTVAQLNLMVAAGSNGEVPTSAIVRALSMERSTLCRNMALLTERGLISVRPHGRTGIVALTDQGRRLLEQARAPWEKAQKKAADALGNALAAAFFGPKDILPIA